MEKRSMTENSPYIRWFEDLGSGDVATVGGRMLHPTKWSGNWKKNTSAFLMDLP
jgi:hypothetical protein